MAEFFAKSAARPGRLPFLGTGEVHRAHRAENHHSSDACANKKWREGGRRSARHEPVYGGDAGWRAHASAFGYGVRVTNSNTMFMIEEMYL